MPVKEEKLNLLDETMENTNKRLNYLLQHFFRFFTNTFVRLSEGRKGVKSVRPLR